MDALWIILTGALVALNGALLGSFLLLRRMSLVGDAISHAVLPGIVVAYLFTASLTSPFLLLGAALTGLFTTWIIEILNQKARLQHDAAIGLTFTLLFAMGVIMVANYTGKIDLDMDCVLYGEIAYVPLDTITLASGADIGPKQVWVLGSVFLALLGLLLVGYRGLSLTTFDVGYAKALGINTGFWHYALMGAVSLSTVAAFESVGAILVVAFLVGPAATAFLLTQNLKWMLVIASITGIASAVLGYYIAMAVDGSISGSMAVATGVLFALAFIWQQVSQRLKLA